MIIKDSESKQSLRSKYVGINNIHELHDLNSDI